MGKEVRGQPVAGEVKKRSRAWRPSPPPRREEVEEETDVVGDVYAGGAVEMQRKRDAGAAGDRGEEYRPEDVAAGGGDAADEGMAPGGAGPRVWQKAGASKEAYSRYTTTASALT